MAFQLASVSVAFSGDVVLDGVSWRVHPGQRVGLIGPNGSGKTTLLRLFAGEMEPDSGQVVRPRGHRVGFLRQDPEIPAGATVEDVLFAPLAEVAAARTRMTELQHRIDQAAERGDAAAAERHAHDFAEVEERFSNAGGYTARTRGHELMARFGLADMELSRQADTLSGGEKGRLALAALLLGEPDLLLMDEPTNHLDLAGVEQLEEVLRTSRWTAVIVSHDRYFLDRVTNQTVEVGNGSLDHYAGNYSFFASERPQRYAHRYKAYQEQQEEIARVEAFIRKNIAGQKTNQAKGRRKALARLERIAPPDDPWSDASRFGIGFSAGERSSMRIAELQDVSVQLGDRTLFRELDLLVRRGHRLGIVGPNGAGKTTLLKILLGDGARVKGKLQLGENRDIGYYEQEHRELKGEGSVLEELQSIAGTSGPYASTETLRTYLGRFRFYGDDVFKPVRALSGGERARLAFARLMMEPHNVLFLDEPTNHLDIPAREALERTLADYDGTLIVVSHDRFFLDRMVDRLLVLRGDEEKPLLHLGTWTELSEAKKAQRDAEARATAELARPSKPARGDTGPPKQQVRKGKVQKRREDRKSGQRERRRNRRRLETLEAEIAQLEADLAPVTAELQGEHGGDWEKLNAFLKQEETLRRRLERKMSEWERLGEVVATYEDEEGDEAEA